jgi:hypothetical protein
VAREGRKRAKEIKKEREEETGRKNGSGDGS